LMDDQLSLGIGEVDESAVLRALAAKRCGVVEVRFKANHTRLVSISHDRRKLYLQEDFRLAPPDVIEAVARFVAAGRAGPETRAAAARIREWWALRSRDRGTGTSRPKRDGSRASSRRQPLPCCATEEQRSFLKSLYDRYNASVFGGWLPVDIRLRLSPRLSRSLGMIRYGRSRDGKRRVTDIALHPDLMLPGNERALVDTMLHEMAHAEAFLRHGHRGHGGIWRAVAQRVGCEPRACTDRKILRRRPGWPRTDNVPTIE